MVSEEERSLYARAWVQGRFSAGAEDAADAYWAERWAQEAGAETFFTFAEGSYEADYYGVVGHDMTSGSASYEERAGVWTWQYWGAAVEQGDALPEGLWVCGEVGTVSADDGPVVYLIAEQR